MQVNVSKVVTFEDQPPEGMINFGVGQPAANLLPLDLMQAASERFYQTAEPLDLNYGLLQGDPRYLESLATFLSHNYHSSISADSLFLSGGCSQALDFICAHFSKAGDTIFVEEPCYFLAFQIFADHDLNIVSVPTDDQGMDIDALEILLETIHPSLIYTIPSFQNPSGRCISETRRLRLADLSIKHDFLIVADEVYQLLSYYEAPPPAFGTFVNKGNIFSIGSFSKILAPGIRLGWIQSSSDKIQALKNCGAINSGGSLNHYASHIVRHAIDMGLLQAHLDHLRTAYRSKVEAMQSALELHLADHFSWTRPDGGYFFWLKLNQEIDTIALKEKALNRDVGFTAGELFSSQRRLQNYIRLSFAHYNEDDILDGILRLKSLFNE